MYTNVRKRTFTYIWSHSRAGAHVNAILCALQLDRCMRDLHVVQWKERPGVPGAEGRFLCCSCLGFWHIRMCSHMLCILDHVGLYVTKGGVSMVDAWTEKAPIFNRGRKSKQASALSKQTTPNAASNSNSRARASSRTGAGARWCW